MNRSLPKSLHRATSVLACLLLVACGGGNHVRSSSDRAGAVEVSESADVTYSGEFEEVAAAFESGDLKQAAKLLTEVTTREPGHATAWANLGMVLSRSANDDEAIAALEQAVSIDSQLAPALNQLGVLYRRAGRLAEAERTYAQSLEIDPDNARTHRNVGVLYDVYLARPADALRHYQRALDLEPEGELLASWVAELERRVQVLEATNR